MVYDMTQHIETADQAFDRLSGLYQAAVGPFLEADQPFALMDFPDHPNIGDSAIYVGELAFFDTHAGRAPSYVNTFEHDPAEVNTYVPDGPISVSYTHLTLPTICSV